MEGTISTMDEILLQEAEYGDDLSGSTEARSDGLETYLFQRSLKTAQKALKEGRPFSASQIKSIHRQLLSWGRGAQKSPGAFQTEQNYIGERGSREVGGVLPSIVSSH